MTGIDAGTADTAPRVVLDTNVLISALVFSRGPSARLRWAWQEGHCTPLASEATVRELARVLAYAKFRLDRAERQELLADYLPWCSMVRVPEPPPRVPPCRDCFDLPFLQLAVAGQAQWLVSGDRGLLALAGSFVCPIVALEVFLQTLQAAG